MEDFVRDSTYSGTVYYPTKEAPKTQVLGASFVDVFRAVV